MIGQILLIDSMTLQAGNDFSVAYLHIRNYYETMKHAHAQFCLFFFRHCYDGKRFIEIIHTLKNLLETASDNKYDFLYKLRSLNIFYIDTQLWYYFQNSLEDLGEHDMDAYEKVLMNLKSILEEMQEYKCRLCREFEIGRFDNYQQLDWVTLHGHCSACKKFVIVSLNLFDYLDSYIQMYANKEQPDEYLCRKCGQGFVNFEVVV